VTNSRANLSQILHPALMTAERVLAALDELISLQVNEILHHREFQKLEARWRGLRYLVNDVVPADDEHAQTIVKLFDIEWRELAKDVEFAGEFTQSLFFRSVYDQEFGAPGGKPYGLLLADYEIGATGAGSASHDLTVLRAIGDTAAAAFAPFVAQADAALLGLDHIRDLQRQLDLRLRFNSPEMRRWNDLRAGPDSRFLGLVLPRILIRLPYLDDGQHDFGFRFREDVSDADGRGYCWASGIWALGSVAIRAFQESGWFVDIRGVRRGERGSGLVDGLPQADYGSDSPGVCVRTPVEICITDETERELAEQGFICLCPSGAAGDAAFYTIPSLSRPAVYETAEATANANISAMLPYMLCVSRFAHALKVMVRDQIAGAHDAESLNRMLTRWITRYVVEGSTSTASQRASHPLAAASVQVEPLDQSGSYNCVMHLEPHLQFDQMVASVTLKTRLEQPR
jgi:type VI secretion system ImpC/EvpB family protein